MRRKIYRALDKPSAFFGIRGKFMILFALIATVALMLAFIIGNNLGSIIGMVAFFAGIIGDYCLIIYIQGRMSEKAFTRSLFAKKLPHCLRVKPHSIKSLLKYSGHGNEA